MSLLSNSGFKSYSFFLIKRHRVRATGLTQVVLIPRLITYLCCYLLDQNGVRVRTRNNTDRVESSFDQSPSLISQSLFCAQGTRALAQVALAYLVVSGTFCFPGITSSTVPPGLVSKYPGRVPKGALVVWRLWGWVCLLRVGSCLGGFWLSRARASAFFIRTHSQRETWALLFPRPTGSLTARVLGDSGSAPPRVSTPSSSFVSRHLGPRVRSHTGSSQQSPAPWLRLGPRPLAGVSPSRRKACLFR